MTVEDWEVGALYWRLPRGIGVAGLARPNDFSSLMLTGQVRRAAIRGEVPLSQIEARLGRTIPADRCLSSQSSDIEVFRSREDDRIMEIINSGSVTLEDLCDHGRGEEMSKSGLLWTCPSCMRATVPGRKRKGGLYHPKQCPPL